MSRSLKQPELFPSEELSLLHFEQEAWQQGCFFVAGVDEAGRGPLAGPVVAAAVIVPPGVSLPEGVNDSKKLSAAQRRQILKLIYSHADIRWSVGLVEADEIDQINILQATYVAMRKAVEGLLPQVDFCLVDGLPVQGLPVAHKAIVKGDSRSYSIAAASIIAKETRDELMISYDSIYPGYGFAGHKGYGTRSHIDSLNKLGPCPIHRRSFAPVREAEGKFHEQR